MREESPAFNKNPEESPAFNMALSTLERIHCYLKDAADNCVLKLPERRIISLNLVYKEIHNLLAKEDVAKYESLQGKTSLLMIEFKTLCRKANSLSTWHLVHAKMRDETFEKLSASIDTLEILLKDLLWKKNLMMPRKDDPRFAVEKI